MMKCNIGKADKVIRIFVGLGMLSLIFLMRDPSRFFGLIGVIPLVTGIAGTCPIYSLLGINSCKSC